MKRQSFLSKWIYLAPALILMLLFYIWPLILSVYYSFTNLALTGTAAANLQFIGLKNFQTMFSDRGFSVALVKTLVFLIGSIAGQTVLGFLIAYFMRDSTIRVRRISGIIILAAWIMPELVASVCTYSFFTSAGSMNKILELFGANPVAWLFDHPMLSVVVSNIWRGTAFSMMVYQSALDTISREVEEAAMLEGVNRIQNITRIILPQIKQTIWTNTLMITLKTLGCFGMIYAMTGGGPGTQTQTLAVFTYLRAFKNNKLGYACACSLVLMGIGMIVSVLYVIGSRKDSKEG